MCEGLTKIFFHLIDPYIPLCMEHNIVQMSVAASYGDTNSSGSIFNDSALMIALVMLTLRTSVDCGFSKPHKKESSGVKSHDLGGQFTSPLREITIPSNRSCRMCIVVSAVWHVTPSCWNHTSSTSISFNLGQKKSVIIIL